MRLRSINACLTLVVMIVGVVWTFDLMRAQEASPSEERAAEITPTTEAPVPVEFFHSNHPAAHARVLFGGPDVGNNISAAIRKAAEAVRDAKGNEAKAAAEKALAELLSKYFDEDLVRRETELEKVEERLAKLREQLDRRRAKKQEIVELQTKVALNEADGLGFYEGQPQSPWQTEFGWTPVPEDPVTTGTVSADLFPSGASATLYGSAGSGTTGRTITTTRVDSRPPVESAPPAFVPASTEPADAPK